MGHLLSALWVGFLINSLVGFTAASLCYLVGRLVKFQQSRVLFGYAALIIGIFLSIYGIINAHLIRTQEYTVTIPHLPEQWHETQVVHLTDIHLGTILRESSLQRALTRIQDIDPDLIVMTGDIFDGTDKDVKEMFQPIKNVQPPRGIYFVPGNHEHYLGLEKTKKAVQAYDINYLRNEAQEINGLHIIGWDHFLDPESESAREGLELIRQYKPEEPTLLLSHPPVMMEEARKAGINLHFAGHTHGGQIFPLQILAYLTYNGYHYGLFTENDYHLYVSTGTGTWGPPMRTTGKTEIPVFTLVSSSP